MGIMTLAWLYMKRPSSSDSLQTSITRRFSYRDMPDVNTLDLYEDEYKDVEVDIIEDEKRERRVKKGGWVLRILWRLYYLVA
jgi:AAT family amino acid transporter